MTPTPEAREREARVKLQALVNRDYDPAMEADVFEQFLDAYRTAVRAKLVAEMVESIVDEQADTLAQMAYQMRIVKRITERRGAGDDR